MCFSNFSVSAARFCRLTPSASAPPSFHPLHSSPLSTLASFLSVVSVAMSGLTLNERFTQQMAAASRPLPPHEQRVHVNLGGVSGAANGRGQRFVNGGGQQQQQTSSGRTVGLKKARGAEVQRQSVKQQSAQPSGASRATRRDGVQQRAQSGREKVVQQRRAAAAAAPQIMHAMPLQPAFLAAPVIPQAYQIAPQFLAAPTTLAFNPGQKQTRQQTAQKGAGQKGGAQKGAQQQKGQKGQQQGGKKATTKKGAAGAGANRQAKPAGAGAAGAKGGRQGKGKPAAGAAAGSKGEASKDSLDADMDSYMAAAPVTATV